MTKTVEFFYDYASPYSYLADCQLPQIAANHRATIVANPAFPVRSITLMRAALVAQDNGVFPAFHAAMWRAMWTEQANLADPAVIAETLTRAGLDGQTIMRGTADDAVKARLKANCDDALARGAFGMPTFFVGDEMFFGNDRLDFVEAALARD